METDYEIFAEKLEELLRHAETTGSYAVEPGQEDALDEIINSIRDLKDKSEAPA